MAVFAVTGGGGQAVSWLLGVPGASRTVLEVVVPYASAALGQFMGCEPQQSASRETASKMARTAYERAVHLQRSGVPLVGVACTASIATDRPKRGEHRCHVAAWKADGVTTYSVGLAKGLRDRAGEDRIASRLVLKALAEASGIDSDIGLDLEPGERLDAESIQYADPIKAVLADHVRSVTIEPDGAMRADQTHEGGVLAGSFDPLHEGHRRLAAAASDIIHAPVSFELSIANVDKPPLQESEVRPRAAQFLGKAPVVVTRAETFSQKARLFPGCTFVIGWDTAVRLIDSRYYGGSKAEMLTALVEMRSLGCRFLVAGRVEEGSFRTLDDVGVPAGLEEMFATIPESTFRSGLSSTDLRLAGREA